MKRFFLLLLFLTASLNPAFAQNVYQAHTHVQLLAEQDTVAAGNTFWVGIDFLPDEGWHFYWQNPGDSGLAPRIKWDLPSSVRAGDIQWPFPSHINLGPLTSYGYEHETLLLVPITIDKNSSLTNINLHAHVDWLTCKDICIPGKAEFNLPLTVVKDSVVAFNSAKFIFDKARQGLPQVNPSITSQVFINGNQWHLLIQAPSQAQGEIYFYPLRDDVIEHAQPQITRTASNNFEVLLTKSHLYQGDLKVLEGVAVNPNGWDEQGTKAIIIQAPVVEEPLHISFLIACLFALIGGLILNLMPCVLPVLSIKVLHLIERHPDKRIALRHSLLYALGILASVWALALLLFILKSAGQFAGWGFQFQSPIFVIAVALILFVLSLNLFGVFEFSAPAISGLSGAQGYQASFISGIITTIVASPCTAPFMGAALTAAISQPNLVGFGIFTCLGLGLALPFIILSAFPSLLSFVPKPGLWMIRLKQFFGIILLVCVIWLLWVFSLETGMSNLSSLHQSSNEIQWQAYSPMAVSEARGQGKAVFIDFTAAWCINCQVNDRLVLQSPDVVRAFKENSISAFKADWTKYDPVITKALAIFGRNSIPVYVYYAPNADTPIILPQVITPKTILEKIQHQ